MTQPSPLTPEQVADLVKRLNEQLTLTLDIRQTNSRNIVRRMMVERAEAADALAAVEARAEKAERERDDARTQWSKCLKAIEVQLDERDRADSLSRDLTEARKALEPFAICSDNYIHDMDRCNLVVKREGRDEKAPCLFTVGDLRRARAALSKEPSNA